MLVRRRVVVDRSVVMDRSVMVGRSVMMGRGVMVGRHVMMVMARRRGPMVRAVGHVVGRRSAMTVFSLMFMVRDSMMAVNCRTIRRRPAAAFLNPPFVDHDLLT